MEKSENKNKNEVTIQLFDPIEWGSKGLIEELVIKAPRGKHMAHLPAQPAMKDLAKVAAKASGYEEAFLGELHIKDYQKVIEVTSAFLDAGE